MTDDNNYTERERQSKYPCPSVAVDIIATGLRSYAVGDWRRPEKLFMSILLVKRGKAPFKDCWALPGGFYRPSDKDLAACARREMMEETNLPLKQLIQMGNFSRQGRDPRGWVISIPFLAIVRTDHMSRLKPKGGDDAAEAKWLEMTYMRKGAHDLYVKLSDGCTRVEFIARCKDWNEAQPHFEVEYMAGSDTLAFDHAEIVSVALHKMSGPGKRQRAHMFLGDEFTMADLRYVYDFMAGEKSIPQNFRRNTIEFLEATGGERGGKGFRPAALYRWVGEDKNEQ